MNGYNRKREQLGTLRELSVILNGECSEDMQSCPGRICRSLFQKEDWNGWCCYDCVHLFQDYVNMFHIFKRYNRLLDRDYDWQSLAYGSPMEIFPYGQNINPCPCVLSGKLSNLLPGHLVIARVEERIIELEEELCVR